MKFINDRGSLRDKSIKIDLKFTHVAEISNKIIA